MSDLLKNTVTVRGIDYVVQEMTARQMAQVRKLLSDEKWKVEAYIAQACCVSPKISAAEADTLPQYVIEALSNEALRLTKLDPSSPDSMGNG